MTHDALVAPLRAEVVSGAAAVARIAADVVCRGAVRLPAPSVDAFRSTMAELLVRIVDAQPAMAPLVHLTRVVHEALDGPVDEVEEARQRASRAANRFRESVEPRTRAAGERAARLLSEADLVLTISSSSSVRAALLAPEGPRPRVVCLEGRPLMEGRILAEQLAHGGCDVTLAVDAAASALLDGVGTVLIGADSIGDAGVVNKIGSHAVAVLARARRIPVVVAADSTKLLPRGFPQVPADDRPADEVWRAPAGVRVWNRYFETVPTELVSTVVTESETVPAEDLDRSQRELHLPPPLRVWANERRA